MAGVGFFGRSQLSDREIVNARILGLIAWLLVLPCPASAGDCAPRTIIAEVTHVRDGDTIEVGGLPIRLNGLAAPEGNEIGGTEATKVRARSCSAGNSVRTRP